MKKEEKSNINHEISERERQKQYDSDCREVLKFRQGISENADAINELASKPIVLTTRKEKFKNFIYYNGFYFVFGLIAIIVIFWLVKDIFMRKTPDATILLLSCENNINLMCEQIEDVFEEAITDINGDGEVYVQVISTPITISQGELAFTAQTRYASEMSAGTCYILIADTSCEEAVDLVSMLDDISSDFPASDNVVDEYKYMLKGTKFEDIIGSDYVADDLYISLRKPQGGLAQSEKKSASLYEAAKETFKSFVEYID